MKELCIALEPELAAWIAACAALESLLASEPMVARVAAADGFSLVARSTAALSQKHSWVTRDGHSLLAPPPDDPAAT